MCAWSRSSSACPHLAFHWRVGALPTAAAALTPQSVPATDVARYDEQHDFTQQDFVQLVNVNNVVLSTIKREMSGGQAMIPHTDPAMGLDGLTSPVNARGTVGSVGSSSFLHSHGWGDRPLA